MITALVSYFSPDPGQALKVGTVPFDGVIKEGMAGSMYASLPLGPTKPKNQNSPAWPTPSRS